MNRIARITIKLGIFALFFWGAERFVHRHTLGFTLVNMQDPHPFDTRWETKKPSEEKLLSIKKILDQPFTLIYAGGQSYAFLSHDDQYILKITKYKRMRVPLWAQNLPLKGFFAKRRETTKKKKKKIFDYTFNSYLIAEKELSLFCGLEYLHLNKTDYLKQKLTLIDRLGISYQIDLDEYEFILQKRAILTHPYIDQLMIEGKIEDAKEAISKLLRFIAFRISIGVEDHDICFGTNFGFYRDEPFQIDIGSLRYNYSFFNAETFNEKIEESSNELLQWIQNHHPELVEAYWENIAKLQEERELGPISYFDSAH